MTAQLIAQIVFGLFVAFGGILALGKYLVERDNNKGSCDIGSNARSIA